MRGVTNRCLLAGDLQITKLPGDGLKDGRLDLRPVEQVGFFHRQTVLVDGHLDNTGDLHDPLHNRPTLTVQFEQINVGGA